MGQSNKSKQKGGWVKGDGVYGGPLQDASEGIEKKFQPNWSIRNFSRALENF